MNPSIEKIARANLENTFSLMISDFLINNVGADEKMIKEFAAEMIGMAKAASMKSIKSAFDVFEDKVQDLAIEESLKNPKISNK